MAVDQQRVTRLATGGLWRLLAEFSWPALVSMTLNALYNVIDRLYIGQGCGTEAIAGLTLTFPVMMVYASFGVLIGVGSSALLSIKLGAKNRVDAEKVLGQCVALKVALGLFLPPLMFCFLETILRWSGGGAVSEIALGYARQYLKTVLFFQLFSHLAFGLSGCIRSEGSPRASMFCMVVGFGLNLVLDPIFIFGLKLGVLGAAWATNIAMIGSCAFALAFYLKKGRSVVRLRLRRVWFYPDLAARVFGIGMAPFLQLLSGSVINFSMNYAFGRWSATQDAATCSVAAFGIFQTVAMLCFMPIGGMQQGLGPIIGYNWGARNFQRVRETLFVGIKATCAACFLAWAIQVFCSYPLARCFAKASETALLNTASHAMRVANCMIWLIGINVVATTFYQSVGRAHVAVFLSLLRQVICLLPCVWILPHLFANHELAIWLSMPVSDTLCCLATLPVVWWETRRLAQMGVRKQEGG